jgi:chorismate mutase
VTQKLKKNTSVKFEKDLEKLRKQINEQDKMLLLTLRNRFKIVKKVALLKKKHDLPVLQSARWKTIIADRVKRGLKYKLNPDFTSAIMKLIHKESIRLQLILQSKKGKK